MITCREFTGKPLFNPNGAFVKDLMGEDFEIRFEAVYPNQLRVKHLYRLIDEPRNLLNPYADGFFFDLYAFVSENETSFQSESELVWLEKNLIYGADSPSRELQTRIAISEVSQPINSKYLLSIT